MSNGRWQPQFGAPAKRCQGLVSVHVCKPGAAANAPAAQTLTSSASKEESSHTGSSVSAQRSQLASCVLSQHANNRSVLWRTEQKGGACLCSVSPGRKRLEAKHGVIPSRLEHWAGQLMHWDCVQGTPGQKNAVSTGRGGRRLARKVPVVLSSLSRVVAPPSLKWRALDNKWTRLHVFSQ